MAMKKTSSSQFELMVTFMEQRGDLSKPISNARDRVAVINWWDELTTMLNSDGSGDIKTCEKWKKVWSDYKNNTKKKVARLNKAAHATGGGPAIYAKLSELEQRVINLMGLRVATSLPVEEAGLSQRTDTSYKPEKFEYTMSIDSQLVEYPENPEKPWPSPFRAVSSPPLAFEEVHIVGPQPSDEPGLSNHQHAAQRVTGPSVSPLHVTLDVKKESISPTLSMLSSPDSVARAQSPMSAATSPSHAGQTSSPREGQTTPHHTTRTRVRGSPRRLSRRLRHTEQAMEQFLHAEQQWRNFKMEQHRDYVDLRREQNRIREMEVQAQRGWQALGTRALNLLEKLVNKYT